MNLEIILTPYMMSGLVVVQYISIPKSIVIPKVEPRLLGFKLREIFKDNSIKSKSRLNWYVIKDIGKSYNH